MARKIILGKGREMAFNEGKMPVYESVEEWQAEGKRRFGEDVKKWRFVCPMCGHVAAVQDFIDKGVKDPANAAYEECIGRYTGAGAPSKENKGKGCNWAAYGLFGIPNGGAIVITGEKDGEETGAHIFEFAEEVHFAKDREEKPTKKEERNERFAGEGLSQGAE